MSLTFSMSNFTKRSFLEARNLIARCFLLWLSLELIYSSYCDAFMHEELKLIPADIGYI